MVSRDRGGAYADGATQGAPKPKTVLIVGICARMWGKRLSDFSSVPRRLFQKLSQQRRGLRHLYLLTQRLQRNRVAHRLASCANGKCISG